MDETRMNKRTILAGAAILATGLFGLARLSPNGGIMNTAMTVSWPEIF
jgi:hypothetical protein